MIQISLLSRFPTWFQGPASYVSTDIDDLRKTMAALGTRLLGFDRYLRTHKNHFAALLGNLDGKLSKTLF